MVRPARKWLLGAALFWTACAPPIRRVDDVKLAGIPADQMVEVERGRKNLALAQAELAKASDAVREAEYVTDIRRSVVHVAEAMASQRKAEFELASWKGQTGAVVAAGQAQSGAERDLERARLELALADARLRTARAKEAEARARVEHADAEVELERLRVALTYEEGTPEQKAADLAAYKDVLASREKALASAVAYRESLETDVIDTEARLRLFDIDAEKRSAPEKRP